MSLYNMLNGLNPCTFFILPMLGEKHPDYYPRFRNCYVENGLIHVYTRVGGGNRDCGYGEEELYAHPNFMTTFDNEFDNTYATYTFTVPDEFKSDYDKIVLDGDLKGVSQLLKDRVRKVYPELEDKLNELWS